MKTEKPIVLIYDDKCSLCCGCMNWIKSHAIKEDVFEFIPCRSEERKSRFPEIREKACLEALHLITPDDRVIIGDRSLPEIISRLRYFRLSAVFFKMPVVNLLWYVIYRWLANNRYVISRTILPLTEEKV